MTNVFGYSCDPGGLCQPDNGTCDCTATGAQRTCQLSNTIGTCLGFETCDPGVGWVGCTAALPTVEDCDGLDNDCNGFIDDGLPQQQVCANKNGFGECAGFAQCYGSAGWVCLADTPEAETCDFKDNNCDGVVDEGFVDSDGKYSSVDHCGTCNSPCGDVFPNSLVEVCDTSSAVPQCIIDSCEEGFLKLTEFQCLEIPDVACYRVPDANCLDPRAQPWTAGASVSNPAIMGCVDGTFCSGGLCFPTPTHVGQKMTVLNVRARCEQVEHFGFETCDGALGWGECDALPPKRNQMGKTTTDLSEVMDFRSISRVNTNQFGSCDGQAVVSGAGWVCQAPAPEAKTAITWTTVRW